MRFEPSWIDVATVYTLHERQLTLHGGSAGVRDRGLIESAVMRPRQIFEYELPPPTIERLAGAYAYGLAKNHGFVDGNKRVAAVTAIAFLRTNQRELEASSDEVYAFFTSIAEGSIDEPTAVAWFEERCTVVKVWQPTR